MGESELVNVLKSTNLRDVIYTVAKSFEDIQSSTIVISLRKAWPGVQEGVEKNVEDNPMAKKENVQESEADDNVALLKDLQKLPGNTALQTQDAQEWVIRGDNELINEKLTDDKIVQAILSESQEED